MYTRGVKTTKIIVDSNQLSYRTLVEWPCG